MPLSFARFVWFVLSLAGVAAWAVEPVDAEPRITLSSDASGGTPSVPLFAWIEPGRSASIERASSAATRYTSASPEQTHPTDSTNTLWLKLEFVRMPGAPDQWSVNLPLPYLDDVVLHQRDASGRWRSQHAGDQLARDLWSKRGLYPDFDLLPMPQSVPTTVYLQIRNYRQTMVPVRVIGQSEGEQSRLGEMMMLGVLMGSLLSLSILSFIRFVEHRNKTDLLASGFGFCIAITLGQLNGVMNAFIWTDGSLWGDIAGSALPPLGMGMSLLFLRNLYALASRHRRYDRFLVMCGWLTMGTSLTLVVMDRAIATAIINVTVGLATMVGLSASVMSWRYGAPVGRWLVASYSLQFVTVLQMVLQWWGVSFPDFWQMRYVTTMAIASSVPLLSYALSRATHDKKELAFRADHLPQQDALTGLLTRDAFVNQMGEAYLRVIKHGEPVALVLVNVINHSHIRQAYGDTTAEQCLLRAVVKLHRVLRDVDPAGRLNTAQFGMVLEGVTDKETVNERMVRLIASGLIPLPGLEPEVTLQFQAACVLLHHNPLTPDSALLELNGLLNDMSPRTRRPIRFLEAPHTHPATQSPPADETIDAP
jgi:GGDEF domain-containing protein